MARWRAFGQSRLFAIREARAFCHRRGDSGGCRYVNDSEISDGDLLLIYTA